MKILVCVKVINGEINPFDQSAIECALNLSSDVTVISMGPIAAKEALLTLTRLGVKAVLISDHLYQGSDTLATSYILAEAIKRMEYDLILCGRQSIDGDTAQVGPMLSANLSLGVVTGAISISKSDKGIYVTTREQNIEEKLPVLVTLERSYTLRFPSIFSKTGTVNIWDNGILKCEPERIGLNGSPTRVLQTFENQRGKRKCTFISKDELIPLIEKLKTQTKKEKSPEISGLKFPCVWAIGEEVYEKAQEISEKVVLLKKVSATEIVKRAENEKPDVILFGSDSWARKNAPVVAAKLKTGLCADCTHLETDGETLYMYRPAQGGNIIAKIKCLTKPQMATVRCVSTGDDIVVSGGKGVGDTERLEAFAKKIGAQTGASRGLVDTGKAPYEKQIGLTGKTISPRIYIAIGISGAVHHTCAIEGADTVIAINPDKEARIFEYADYGIVENFDDIKF